MASPFDIFRKNQKVLMVALTVLAMIAFVLSDNLDLAGRGGGVPEDPVVVESRYFTLHDSQLSQALVNRELVHRFVVQAVATALEQQQLQQMRVQFPQIPQEQLAQFVSYDRIGQQANAYADGRFGPATERSVVDTLVLADQAKRMGMTASDGQVFSFIAQTVQGLLNGDQLNAIMRNINSPTGGKVTLRQMTEAFRNEMLAVTMRTLFSESPGLTLTPLDRWSAYVRKRCRATAEVLAVSTADIVKQGLVPDPSDAELARFYDKYRFDVPQLGSPDPGFKMPPKARFQYLAADESKFFEPEKITAEQIAAHYETNKSRYPYVAEDFTEPVVKPEPKADVKVEAKPEVKAEAKPEAKPEPKTETKPEVKPEPKVEAKPETKPEVKSEPKVEAKPETKPEAAAPAAKGPTTVSPDCGDEEASSCEQATDEKKTDAPKADAAPTATPTATSAPAPTATASGTAPSPVAKATATATATPPAAATVLPPPPLPTQDLLLPDDVRIGRNPQYEPLWKVEKKIRDELARKAANDQVRALFDEIKPELIEAALARDVTKPDVLIYDEKQWAEKFAKYPQLVAKTTPELSDAEALVAAEEPGLFKATVNSESFVRAAYADAGVYVPKEAIEVPEFSLSSAEKASTVRYLWWKVAHESARVPELAEIRSEVIFAWKTREARALARKQAEELAKQARQSPKSLAEQFPNRDVKLTNAFAWYEVDLSGGFNEEPTPTRVSRVDGVEDAGDEFMQAAFGLELDQVGTAMNNPETICYVMRVTSLSPPRAQLYDSFMVDHFQTYQTFARADGVRDSVEAYRALLSDAGLKWLREPRDRNR